MPHKFRLHEFPRVACIALLCGMMAACESSGGGVRAGGERRMRAGARRARIGVGAEPGVGQHVAVQVIGERLVEEVVGEVVGELQPVERVVAVGPAFA